MQKALLFTAALVATLGIAQVHAIGCAPVNANGKTIDISQIAQTTVKNLQQVKDGTPGGSYDWPVNLCTPQNFCADGNTFYLSQYSAGTTQCNNAQFMTMTQAPTWDGSHVVVKYTDKSQVRFATVTIGCGSSPELSAPSGQFTTTLDAATQHTTFGFSFTTSLACGGSGGNDNNNPDDKKGGLTWGGAFLLIFFLVPLVYALATVGYNYYKGQRGKDLAPHPEFWTALPYLFLDGVKFTAAKLLALCGKGDGTFTPSGGASSGASGGAAKTSGYSAI